MKKFQRAFRHHFNPNSVCDKNTDWRWTDVQSPILWNFRFRWHFCKNHICIRLSVQCFQLVHSVIHCRDWNVMFLTPCFASLPTGLKFMDSFRPQCDFFICFHNDTVSFLCYEKSVSEKYSCGQIRMITYLQSKKLLSRHQVILILLPARKEACYSF